MMEKLRMRESGVASDFIMCGLVESGALRVKRGPGRMTAHTTPALSACLYEGHFARSSVVGETPFSQRLRVVNTEVDGAAPHDAYCACVTSRHN
jgi:hypothetical protein